MGVSMTISNVDPCSPDSSMPTVKPIISHQAGRSELWTIRIFLIVPLVVPAVAIPWIWGWGFGWTDLAMSTVLYVVSMIGVTVGYHRLFTHRSFRASRGLRIALAVAGGFAAQGSVIPWAADHRRHHAFSDQAGDPHSPWIFGTSPVALMKGFWHAHMGWMFGRERTNIDRYAPDLAADRDLLVVDRLFFLWVSLSVLLPAAVGGLISHSWRGALTGFIWAGLGRIAFQHHVTWSVNSICHMVGSRPFRSRDRSANFWPLALLSMGESWHNMHHADPSSARHGVLRGQVDVSARLIWLFERLGWAHDVRWPSKGRLRRLSQHAKPVV
ncbi:fatty acid desaturase [Solwaraspora sp. WMMD406]|uniref:acyl-CoA desaturase n=1 Tax=Solwaraspora sp. WMMD406 TaxID=3016095 RepID=UPI003242F774